jgi:hypothetical protein
VRLWPGSGNEHTAATPVKSRIPVVLDGVALLSVVGFAALGFARSWPLHEATGPSGN